MSRTSKFPVDTNKYNISALSREGRLKLLRQAFNHMMQNEARAIAMRKHGPEFTAEQLEAIREELWLNVT